ncbi:MAG: hypothetical protein ACREBC_32955, partial [Pyrinomonadaceae bacterium]
GGFLTLNVPPGTPLANQKVVVIAAGRTTGGQLRVTPAEKTTHSNYVELENADADDTYLKDTLSVTFYDRPINIP